MSTTAKLGLYCALWSVLAVGGNTVALSDVHRATVEVERWITDAQFTASFALAQAAPDPNGMALVLIGLHGRNESFARDGGPARRVHGLGGEAHAVRADRLPRRGLVRSAPSSISAETCRG